MPAHRTPADEREVSSRRTDWLDGLGSAGQTTENPGLNLPVSRSYVSDSYNTEFARACYFDQRQPNVPFTNPPVHDGYHDSQHYPCPPAGALKADRNRRLADEYFRFRRGTAGPARAQFFMERRDVAPAD